MNRAFDFAGGKAAAAFGLGVVGGVDFGDFSECPAARLSE